MRVVRSASTCVAIFCLFGLSGCGLGLDQEYLDAIQISPAAGTGVSTSPTNTVQFTATGWYSTQGYGTLTPTLNQPNQHKVLTTAKWKTSDSVNTSVSASGVATCLSVTNTPATITATAPGGLYGSVSGTASLICN